MTRSRNPAALLLGMVVLALFPAGATAALSCRLMLQSTEASPHEETYDCDVFRSHGPVGARASGIVGAGSMGLAATGESGIALSQGEFTFGAVVEGPAPTLSTVLALRFVGPSEGETAFILGAGVFPYLADPFGAGEGTVQCLGSTCEGAYLLAGQLVGDSLEGTLRVPLNLPTGVPFSIQVRAQVTAYSGSIDFGLRNISFPVTGAVLDLPEGYDFNAPDVGIVNNRWLGAVPEPGGVALLVLVGVHTYGTRRLFRA